MLRKIRSLISNSDFIEIYDNVLTHQECDRLIHLFEKSKKMSGFVVADGVPTEDFGVKNGSEVEDARFSKGDSISNFIKPFFSINERLFNISSLYDTLTGCSFFIIISTPGWESISPILNKAYLLPKFPISPIDSILL